MHPYTPDNIVALATPPGIGALAVVRISGNNLSGLYKDFTGCKPKNRYALYSKIYHPNNNLILDEAVIIFYKSPNSFTGEDVIEISCHGGSVVRNAVINAATESGARLAEPGEFSMRSFLNGKMDLIQAEAISSLISSKSQLSQEICLENLSGKLSSVLRSIKYDTLNLLSIIENELNFSIDEIVSTKTTKIIDRIIEIKTRVDDLFSSSLCGKNIFSGLRVVLYGKPNSGKSTLFNALIGHDRAIMSSVPGTTRDSVESWFELCGVPICLIDTAGIWDSKNELDALSIQKTISELERADICLVIDENDPGELIDLHFKERFKKYYIMVQSKSDLLSPNYVNSSKFLLISSIKNQGISSLLTQLSTHVVDNCTYNSEDGVLFTDRQRALLDASTIYLSDALDQVRSNIGMDIVASTIRGFSLAIMEIIGEIPDKEVIENIFKNFCVGK